MNFNFPQNLKYKKYNKKFAYGSTHKLELRSSFLFVGSSCGIVALEPGVITISQLKTCIALLNKIIKIKRKAKNKLICSIIIRAPITEKSLGSRMGRGKGAVSKWVCHVKKGRLLFQVQNVKRVKAVFIAMRQISYKLPILTKIVLKKPLFYQKYIKNVK